MALSNLLVSMFSADELRRLVRYLPGGEGLAASLPGPTASAMALADATVELMTRQGRLDELVQAARRERPRRAHELDAWAAPVAPDVPEPWPMPREEVPPATILSLPGEVDTRRRRPSAPRLPMGCRTFVSYAGPDRPLIERLEVSLALLKRQGYIQPWLDYRMEPGVVWSAELDAALDDAQLVLLGVSDFFNASEFCWGTELARTLARQAAGEAVRVIPIFLRPSDTTGAPYMRFQGLPAGGRSVTEHPNADLAWKAVAEGLRSLF